MSTKPANEAVVGAEKKTEATEAKVGSTKRAREDDGGDGGEVKKVKTGEDVAV